MTRPPLLMLPGHMCDQRLWAMVEPGLLSSGREVVHGDITRESSIGAIALAILASAPPRFIAVGLSMGGIVAFELVRQAPQRLAALVLCDTNPAAESPERAAMRRAQQAKVRDGFLADVVRDELKPAYLAPENRARQDILDLTFAMALELGPEVFLRQSEALIARPDSWPTIAEIDCPTLVLCGSADPVCPPQLHRAMADKIPGSELRLVDGAGHLPPLERPEQFTGGLLSWLETAEKEQ